MHIFLRSKIINIRMACIISRSIASSA